MARKHPHRSSLRPRPQCAERSMSIDGRWRWHPGPAQAPAHSREVLAARPLAHTHGSVSQSGLAVDRTPEQSRTLKSLGKATRAHAPPMIEATAEGPGPVANGGRLASRAAYFKIRRTPPTPTSGDHQLAVAMTMMISQP